MGFYPHPRPAIFLPGDSRSAPAYERRDAQRLERRRASDPYAPDFVRSTWRRSDACLRQWQVGEGGGNATLYLRFYREACIAYLRVCRRLQATSRATWRLALQARRRFIQSVLTG